MSNYQQAVNQKQQLAKQKLEHYLEHHEAIKEAIEENHLCCKTRLAAR